MKICLDPGHGQYGNPGYLKEYYEGTQMFKLAHFQKELLEQYQNVSVEITRKTLASDPTLLARGKTATNFDLFISDHSNAPGSAAQKAGTYNKITGTSVYDTVAKPNPTLGKLLGSAVSRVMNDSFTAVQYRKNSAGIDWYGVLRYASQAGCKSSFIVEHGFHTNPRECAFLLEDANLKKLAQVEVAVIAEYYKLVKEEDMEIRTGSKGQAVYSYQVICKKLGGNIGEFGDMVLKGSDGKPLPTGCDGNCGPKMLAVTNALQKRFGLPITSDGFVSDELYGKLNLELQKLQTGVSQEKYNAKVTECNDAIIAKNALQADLKIIASGAKTIAKYE